MKAFLFVAAFALCATAIAQSPKDQALGDGANKQVAPAAEGAGRSAASGDSPRANESFTHGESARCEKLSGDEKVQCDKEEATKSQGENAEELSKTPQKAND